MDKKEREERFDGLLFSIAEQHPAGVLDVKNLKSIFFMSRFLNLFNFPASSNDCWISGS